MEVAFTGTQHHHPRSPEIVNSILDTLPIETVIRTGACVGVDELVAVLSKDRGFYVRTYVPANQSKIDLDFVDHCNEVVYCPGGPEPYRIRNTWMVSRQNKEIELLVDHLYVIALHAESDHRSIRSGTWMTKRIAEKLFIPITEYLLEVER